MKSVSYTIYKNKKNRKKCHSREGDDEVPVRNSKANQGAEPESRFSRSLSS